MCVLVEHHDAGAKLPDRARLQVELLPRFPSRSGIGRVFPVLALVGGPVEHRSARYLSLSFDHRALDGAPAARFLNRVKSLLELPVGLL